MADTMGDTRSLLEEQPWIRPTELRDQVPLLGYRNYWYPGLLSSQVGGKPRALRLLGDDLVLFRAGGSVYALEDRCAHRGTRLSKGHCLVEGTITCAYHGWTYDGSGQCVAALTEGPESALPSKAQVRAYPVDERKGVVWIYVGELEAPPLDELVPRELCDPARVVFPDIQAWNSNWRLSVENFSDPSHAPYLHRNALRLFFTRMPAWMQAVIQDSPDGQGFLLGRKAGSLAGEFPVVGKWPRRSWWRFRAPSEKTRKVLTQALPNAQAEVRLPGYIRVTRPSEGMIQVQWSVPVDESHSRQFLFTTQPLQGLRAFLFLAYCQLFYRWVHNRLFTTGQDGWVCDIQEDNNALSIGEKLSINDVGIIRWRQLSARARGRTQPPRPAPHARLQELAEEEARSPLPQAAGRAE